MTSDLSPTELTLQVPGQDNDNTIKLMEIMEAGIYWGLFM